MAYATSAQFRRVSNFTTKEISDTDITDLIADADRAIVRLTTTEIYLEQLEGDIDGNNTDFKTKHSPIADADADSDVDGDDVTVYYATYDDTTNWVEMGSSQTVTSIQANEGIITMTTAPTTTTAEAGVFATYRYTAKGVTDYDILKLASCYYLAYMVANKLRGKTPNFEGITSPYIRSDTVGSDWLKLCFETLGLQDKVYLVRPEGDSIDSSIGN